MHRIANLVSDRLHNSRQAHFITILCMDCCPVSYAFFYIIGTNIETRMCFSYGGEVSSVFWIRNCQNNVTLRTMISSGSAR